jgi:FkbM family methyltransferase
VENKGLENGCKSGLCENVVVSSLDSYVEQHVSPYPIDYLSIDVEGFDFDVLLGGLNDTLPRVKYLEFEFNWMGSRKDQSLSDAVNLRQII